ncbi:uncharacterized protein N7529_003237 [Penicillium soppii]|uniref:uncharacterized protein n=1 Tax=Penicillium soppii TaxID=69789 RepID=UPI002546AD55|nr:uncharacterized protein N7529_003237 [Penicillium soppii]KAJ5874807.1 hypothetical protein N7529_003237 [Penicillium soppii]
MVPKACDDCNKEKCTGDSPACTRCSRLKSSCPASRRNKRLKYRSAVQASSQRDVYATSVEPGQRRNSEASAASSSSLSQRSCSRSPSGATEQTWTPESTDTMVFAPEKLLVPSIALQTTSDALRTVMDVEQFSVIHLPFMLGSSFIPEAQKTVYVILRLSAPTLTEGYLAFLGLMTTYQKSLVMRRNEPDMVKAAKGLQRLRSVNIAHDYDAACALFLGQTMYVFNLLTAPYSDTARAIVRSALMSTKKWIPRLIQAPIMDTITMTPVLIDTVECLFHREIPIIRLHPQRRIIVDRYVGLCATLLPHLYDICECSHTLKTKVVDAGSESISAIWDRMDDIEEKIRRWRAQTPPQLFEKYGQHAVLAMFTQANVYRLAALLVIHRLRYPLGVEDEEAQKLANNIFAELAFFAKSASKEASALPVVFPLTVAMFEIEGPGEDLLERLASFTIQTISASRLQDFIRFVRASRVSGFDGIWFDLVDTHLHVAAPP